MTDKNTDNEKPVFFVSRRGRQVGVHEIDLGGIDIDGETKPVEQSKPATSVKQPKTAKAVKTPRQRQGWGKKKPLIFAVVVAVLLLPAALAELVVAEYGKGVTSAKKDLSSLVSSAVLPAQKKSTISADQIRTFAGKVNDIVGRMCRGGLLDNAAQLYPRAKSALSDCKVAQSQYSALTSNLYALESQARYLERIDTLIKPVTMPITDDYAVIGAQQAAWQTAADGVGKLSPPTSMASAHAVIVTHTKAAAEAWSKLNTANNTQDAVEFEAAEKALVSEYEAIRQTSALFSAVLSDTQAKITASYNALR